MRSVIGMAGAALLALATLSCDTTQPLSLDEQTFLLQMSTFGAMSGVFNVYEGFEDNDGDMQPDDTDGDGQPDTFLHCLTRVQTPLSGTPTSVPWGYTVTISILRAGQTQAERITSAQAVTDPSTSVSDYDFSAPLFGSVPANPAPVTISGRTFRFRNGRILFRVRRSVVAQTTSPLIELDPATYGGLGQGRCSLSDPGAPVIDLPTSSEYPRPIVLGKGDTLTVEAFVSPTAPPGIVVSPAPGLAASLSICFPNGGCAALEPGDSGIRGATAESAPGQGFRFSYTTR